MWIGRARREARAAALYELSRDLADAPDEDPVLEVSHEPGGVVNLLTGKVSEMLPHLAKHFEVAAQPPTTRST